MNNRNSAINIAIGFLLATVPLSVFGQTGTWAGDGPEATFTVVSDGTTSYPEFQYHLQSTDAWNLQTWEFHTTAVQDGTIEIPYHYSGFHDWYMAVVFLDAFVIHEGTTSTTPIFNLGPSSYPNYPSGGFEESGTVTLTVESGDTFGFRFGGENYDSSYLLEGTFIVANPPSANLSWHPANPGFGQMVQFTDLSTGSPTSWLWDFGDGSGSNEQNPSHAYAAPGTFGVSLTVTNPYGEHTRVMPLVVIPDPVADFSWQPDDPVLNEEVQFTNQSAGAPTSWSWDIGADGSWDYFESSPTHTFTEVGLYPVKLRVENAYGVDEITKAVSLAPYEGPEITDVTAQYGGIFLEGTDVENRFDATIDWRGSTSGTVRFFIDPGEYSGCIDLSDEDPKCEVSGIDPSASCTFDMGSDFLAQLKAHTVTVEARDEHGNCFAFDVPVWVFEWPVWLELAGGLGLVDFDIGDGEIVASLDADFPSPHLFEDCTIDCALNGCDGGCMEIPRSIPLIGGTFGVMETFATFSASVSSLGTGSVSLKGTTGFYALESSISGWVEGGGEFRLFAPDGLELTRATFSLGLAGSLAKETSLAEIPQVEPLTKLWVIGAYIESILERATLRAQLDPALSITASWVQSDVGELEFEDVSGTLGLDLLATLTLNLGRLTLSAWAGGGGSFTLGLPDPPDVPLLRAADINAQLGLKARLDLFIDIKIKAGVNIGCGYDWEGAPPWDCYADFYLGKAAYDLFPEVVQVTLIETDYARFGGYAVFKGTPVARTKSSKVPVSVDETLMIENLFPGASPAIAVTDAGRLLVWEHQRRTEPPGVQIPVLQSTEIAWHFEPGDPWSEQQTIAEDTRAELSPVLGVNHGGDIVAAWLRIKDPAFDEEIEDVTDLPLYYTQLEVVSAVFSPPTETEPGSWSQISQLTDDNSMDTDLRLVGDAAGNLMLTWLSNPDGEFLSNSDHPSSLMYSFWDEATQSWGDAAAAAANLEGVGSHVAAISALDDAVILVPRDPEPSEAGDEIVDRYNWDGSAWSYAGAFAEGEGGNRAPTMVFDGESETHVVWLQGTDLVQATLGDPEPDPEQNPIRSGSASLAFLGAKLLTSPNGTITLIWQETVDNQPADILAMIYDPGSGTWSQDRRLLELDELVHQASAVYGPDSMLHAAYLTTEIERTTELVTIDEQAWEMTNIPVEGRTDLLVMEHVLGLDLAVDDDDLTLAPARPAPGDPVTATVTVHNAGDLAIGGFDVDLYVGDPDAGGRWIGTQSRPVPPEWFAAGAFMDFEFTFDYPDTPGNLVAVVDSANQVDPEISEDNNRTTWFLENEPPFAVALADPIAGKAPLTVAFNGLSSYDPDGDAVIHKWTFADGTAEDGGEVGHTFAKGGRYPVTLSVTDRHGAVGIDVVVIDVEDTPAGLLAEAIEFFENGLADGSIEGRGPNATVVEMRARVFRELLDTALALLVEDNDAEACYVIAEAVDRCDGHAPPPDYIAGDDVTNLNQMLLNVVGALGCS